MRVLLSNYGYAMLQASKDGVLRENAGVFDQRFFNVMVRRKYLTYNHSKEEFTFSKEGKEALAAYGNTDPTRKNPSDILSKYVTDLVEGSNGARRRKKA